MFIYLGVKQFIDAHQFNRESDPDRLFVFGEKELGDGSDENHFHLGFSTINLI